MDFVQRLELDVANVQISAFEKNTKKKYVRPACFLLDIGSQRFKIAGVIRRDDELICLLILEPTKIFMSDVSNRKLAQIESGSFNKRLNHGSAKSENRLP